MRNYKTNNLRGEREEEKRKDENEIEIQKRTKRKG